MRLSATALLASVSLMAAAQGAPDPQPHQKPGLWREDVTLAGHTTTMHVCLDTAAEAQMSVFGSNLARKLCKTSPIAHDPDGSWSATNACALRPGAKKISRVVVTGSFDAKLSVVTTSPPGGPVAAAITLTWIGPCKPGQKGGDMILSNGTKVNLLSH
jgi:hypothetical protein